MTRMPHLLNNSDFTNSYLTRNISLFIILIISLIVSLSGCAAPYRKMIKDGKSYCVTRGVFKSRWSDYYERALSCIEGEFYQEALFDLNVAIQKRCEDQRMARTYGMRFIDYFPHREKGLIYFLKKNYNQAEKFFSISMKMEPSAKSKYYIDEIHKKRLQKEKSAIEKPTIELDVSKYIEDQFHKFWSKQFPVIISGLASDSLNICHLSINNQSYLIDNLDRKQISFEKQIFLEHGHHSIEILAENMAGVKAKQTISLNIDRK